MAIILTLLFTCINAYYLVTSVRRGDWLWAAVAAACLLVTLGHLR